jgi:hypothetical protein
VAGTRPCGAEAASAVERATAARRHQVRNDPRYEGFTEAALAGRAVGLPVGPEPGRGGWWLVWRVVFEARARAGRGVPASRGHDDLLINAAQTVRLEEGDWRPRVAQGSGAAEFVSPQTKGGPNDSKAIAGSQDFAIWGQPTQV